MSTQSQICWSAICQSVDWRSPKISKMSDRQIDRLTDSRSVNKPADITKACPHKKGKSVNLSAVDLSNLDFQAPESTDWQINRFGLFVYLSQIVISAGLSPDLLSVNLSICWLLIFEIFGDWWSTDWQIADRQIWHCVDTLFAWLSAFQQVRHSHSLSDPCLC